MNSKNAKRGYTYREEVEEELATYRLISHLSGKHPARLSLAWRVYLTVVVCGIYMASMNSERCIGGARVYGEEARRARRVEAIVCKWWMSRRRAGNRERYMYVLLGGELAGIKWQLPPQNAGWTMTYAAPRPAAERSPYSNAGQRIMLRACAKRRRERCFVSTWVNFNSRIRFGEFFGWIKICYLF